MIRLDNIFLTITEALSFDLITFLSCRNKCNDNLYQLSDVNIRLRQNICQNLVIMFFFLLFILRPLKYEYCSRIWFQTLACTVKVIPVTSYRSLFNSF